jgi:hypothetical protein
MTRGSMLPVTLEGSMIHQQAAQERKQGAWFSSLIDRLLDYIDEVGSSLGLPTSADDLYCQKVRVEARIDRLGR